jgi:hypothetical protein
MGDSSFAQQQLSPPPIKSRRSFVFGSRSTRCREKDAEPAAFVQQHGTMSRKRNYSKIGLWLGFCMATVVAPFRVGGLLLPRPWNQPAGPPPARVKDETIYSAESRPRGTFERRSSWTTLFCNRREPWHGGYNTTNVLRNKYTVYGRRFDGILSRSSTVSDGAKSIGNDATASRLVATSKNSKRLAPSVHGFMNGWDGQWINASSFNVHDLLPTDWIAIENYWDRIMPAVSYLGTEKVSKIYKALCVAYSAHRGQMRKSGEPFIVHVRVLGVRVVVLFSCDVW